MEYEVKYKIAGKNEILPKLKQLKAEDLGEEKQVDVYLGLGEKGVRIRALGKEGVITLKRLVDKGIRAKVREELETKVSDINSLIAIFNELGFREVKRKEKIRHAFKLENVFVLIDRIPFMGYFVELEAKSESALKKITKKLDFDYKQAIGDSYDNMFFAYYIKNAKEFKNTKIKILPIFENEKAFAEEQKNLN